MKGFDNLINELITKLLTEGSAEFSQDGLNIKASSEDGCLSLMASFESPVEDNNEVEELRDSFESYIKSLSDDFFIEIAESFEDGELKEIQNKVDSNKLSIVREGISDFMKKLKAVAADKILSINQDIKDAEKELTDLIEIRDSYKHAMAKKF